MSDACSIYCYSFLLSKADLHDRIFPGPCVRSLPRSHTSIALPPHGHLFPAYRWPIQLHYDARTTSAVVLVLLWILLVCILYFNILIYYLLYLHLRPAFPRTTFICDFLRTALHSLPVLPASYIPCLLPTAILATPHLCLPQPTTSYGRGEAFSPLILPAWCCSLSC